MGVSELAGQETKTKKEKSKKENVVGAWGTEWVRPVRGKLGTRWADKKKNEKARHK